MPTTKNSGGYNQKIFEVFFSLQPSNIGLIINAC